MMHPKHSQGINFPRTFPLFNLYLCRPIDCLFSSQHLAYERLPRFKEILTGNFITSIITVTIVVNPGVVMMFQVET